VVVNVGLSVPTGVEPIYHWYDGVVPPFVGVAVKVTLVPAQIGEGTSSVIETLTEEMLFTVMVIVLLVDVAEEGQTALFVITTLTAFPLVKAVVENVALFVPTGVAPIYHWYEGVVPPFVGVAVNVTLSPAQIVVDVEAAMLTEGVSIGFTVTVAEPERSPLFAEQFASLKVAIVYVKVEPGVTLTVIVGAVPLNVAPLLNVPLIVPVPVTVNVRLVEAPAQIVVDPLIAPVGRVRKV
jgi:hypothetical protein